MNKEFELWQFVLERLRRNESVMLLVVADSSGSSPGRKGYKMVVGADGELLGSIGGGVMEVNLVERAKAILSEPGAVPNGLPIEQEHRKHSENPSGMICSGKQTVIMRLLTSEDEGSVEVLVTDLQQGEEPWMIISEEAFKTAPANVEPQNCPHPNFERAGDAFQYEDKLGPKNDLYIIGGGHCSLALSEIMSRLDFKIRVFDDRPAVNTIKKNAFAHKVTILDRYDLIHHQVHGGDNVYVVVMTLGYKSDAEVIRALVDKPFKYFGVLGSNAKMATMLRELVKEGVPREMLDRIRTPVGIPIHSRTPEEVAVSIAAEIISVKNAE